MRLEFPRRTPLGTPVVLNYSASASESQSRSALPPYEAVQPTRFTHGPSGVGKTNQKFLRTFLPAPPTLNRRVRLLRPPTKSQRGEAFRLQWFPNVDLAWKELGRCSIWIGYRPA
jgi:hypothetical protein